MQPLGYDIRSYYRRHQTGEAVEDGIVSLVYTTDGPYSIAFRPGQRSRTLTEQGRTVAPTSFFCIANGVHVFDPGDILTDGENDLYVIEEVMDWPTEQTFYVRGARMSDDWERLDRKLASLDGMADIIEQSAAPQICEVMRNYALDRLDEKVYDGNSNRVTGNLRNSVETASDIIVRSGGTTVTMGIETSAHYAKYVEFGTGVKGSADYDGHVSEGVVFSPKAMWFQHNPEYRGEFGQDNDPENEEWIRRFAQHPRPFMRPALYDNVGLFADIIAGEIAGVFG